jgi:hypothetical protein
MQSAHPIQWNLAQHFVNTWWPPLRAQDQVSPAEIAAIEHRLELALPQALREWYALAGRRCDFIGNQDYLVPIDQLTIKDDVLVFCIENQAVIDWGIRLEDIAQEDPPVVVDWAGEEHDERGQWSVYSPSVSTFFLSMVVQAILLSAQFQGQLEATAELIAAIGHHYPRIELTTKPMHQYFGDSDTLIQIWHHNNCGQTYVHVAMRSRRAVEHFLQSTDFPADKIDHWNYSWGHKYSPTCQDVGPGYILRWPLPEGLEDRQDLPDCHFVPDGPI